MADERKPRELSATERMERARLRTHAVRRETMAFVSLLCRMYPAHRCKAEREQQKDHSIVVCVHTPAGQMAWKLTEDEHKRFAKLPMQDNDWDRHTQAQRIERIDALEPKLKR